MPSPEDLELARQFTRLFNESDIEGMGRLCAPDAVVFAPAGWPEPGPFEGRDAIVRQFVRLREGWRQHRMTHEREEIRGEWILIELHWEAEGGGSGARLEMTLFAAARVTDGQCTEVRYYWAWDDALEDLGLKDEPVTPQAP